MIYESSSRAPAHCRRISAVGRSPIRPPAFAPGGVGPGLGARSKGATFTGCMSGVLMAYTCSMVWSFPFVTTKLWFPGTTHSSPPASTVEKYRAFIEGMNKAVAKLGRKVAYVLSIDWSHIGIKFGDEEPAVNMLSNVRQSDYAQIEALERVDWEAFHSMLHANLNETKIDGYACISAFFDLVNPASGKLFKYEQWHEEERDSAVTYASMGFYKD